MSALAGIAGRVPQVLGGKRRFARLNAILAAALTGIGVLVYVVAGSNAAATAAPVRTSSAQRGVVLSSVSASGAVEPATQLNLDFQSGGTLKSISVNVGRHVSAGQVLAAIDSTNATAAVRQAQASLASANAALQTTLTGETASQRRQDTIALQQSKAGTVTARASLAAAQTAAKLDVKTATAALTQASQQLATDRGNEAVAVAQKTNDLGTYTNVDAIQAAESVAQRAVTDDQTRQHQDQSTQFDLQAQQTKWSQQLAADQASKNTGGQMVDQETLNSLALQLQSIAKSTSNDGYQLSLDQSALSIVQSTLTAVKADQSSIQTYEAKLDADRNAIASATTNVQSTKAKDAQTVESAQQQVASALLSTKSTAAGIAVKQSPPQASAVAQNRAAIVQAQTSLASAQRTLTETVLRAPVAGVVASVSGAVGTAVSGSGSSVASSSSTSSSTAAGGSTGSSTSAGFISLVGVKAMQVKAAFSESDAAKIHLGQAATVTVSALPGVKLAAHVTVIDVTSTSSSSGVVNYNVAFTLDNQSQQLKAGMTASVAVTVAEVDAAVNVPTSAVTGTGANATVTVLLNGKQQSVPVVVGLTGDSATQIVGGLKVGQTVVLPSTTTATTGATPAAGGAANRGAGLRGGGFGGGGIPGG
jgi:HlyD family secretion protein